MPLDGAQGEQAQRGRLEAEPGHDVAHDAEGKGQSEALDAADGIRIAELVAQSYERMAAVSL